MKRIGGADFACWEIHSSANFVLLVIAVKACAFAVVSAGAAFLQRAS